MKHQEAEQYDYYKDDEKLLRELYNHNNFYFTPLSLRLQLTGIGYTWEETARMELQLVVERCIEKSNLPGSENHYTFTNYFLRHLQHKENHNET